MAAQGHVALRRRRSGPPGRLRAHRRRRRAAAAPDTHGWLALSAVTAFMVLALITGEYLPWARFPRRTALAFPLAICCALLGAVRRLPGNGRAPGRGCSPCARPTSAQRPGTILLLLPFAAVTFVICNEGWSRVITVRLIIATVIWTLPSELLARLTAQQAVLADALHSLAAVDLVAAAADVTFSAGTAQCTVRHPATETLKAADQAVWAAKSAGRSRDCVEATPPAG